ncbi:MAG TPA: response regulator [Bryobacteraceae bacterium]|nr:response regulator [Bryobacteraceae bacterium]
MAWRVLVVDDSPVMRGFIRRVIRLSGFDAAECLEAGDGEQALRVLRSQAVDVILTDINMPVMDGEELMEQLAADDRLRSIPVLVVSTDATKLRMARMTELGALGYLSKPFSPEMLRSELERVLEAGS